MKLKDYIWEWFGDKKSELKPSTVSSYERAIKKHIVPDLGHIALSDLRRRHIKKWIKMMMKEPGRSGKGVAQRTIKTRLAALSSALTDALDDELITSNPASGVTVPKTKKFEPIAVSDKMANEILDHAAGSRSYLPIHLGLDTGMRRGELLALRWTDVHLDDGYIKVARSRTTVNGRAVEDTPKTEQSGRDISLAEGTVTYLREHQQQQKKVVFPNLGKKWSPEEYIFVTEEGGPIHPELLSRNFKAIVAEAGYPGLRFHDLRHAHATIMLKAKVGMKVVQERLGHKDYSTTANTYTHVLKETADEAAQIFEDRMKQDK